MKKMNTKGFSIVEVLLVLLVVGAIAGVGWYVWEKQNSDTKQATTVPESSNAQDKDSESIEEYKHITKVPEDWLTLSDSKYSFTYSHPPTWKVKPDSKGNPDQFIYEIGMGESEQMYDAIIGIKKGKLKEVVTTYKQGYLSTEGIKILSEKELLYYGEPAVEIRYSNGGGNIVDRQYFIALSEDTVIQAPVVYEQGPDAERSLTIFESIKFL
jgi:hypothetical protein